MAFIIADSVTNIYKYTLTWNNQPAVTDQNAVYMPEPSTTYEDFEIDLTALIEDSVNDPNNSHGFRLSISGRQYYAGIVIAISTILNSVFVG